MTDASSTNATPAADSARDAPPSDITTATPAANGARDAPKIEDKANGKGKWYNIAAATPTVRGSGTTSFLAND